MPPKMAKKVLAMFRGHSRPASFVSGLPELKTAIISTFQDYGLDGKAFFLKMENEEWGGKFVDIGPSDDIPDRAVVEIHVQGEGSSHSESRSSEVEILNVSSVQSATSTPKQTHLKVSSDGRLECISPPAQRQGPYIADETEICEKAVIYKREQSRPLSNYQKAINDCAKKLCLENPLLVTNRQKLLDTARQEVDITYPFKKGRSRSKRYDSSQQPPSKKAKTSRDEREKRIEFINETLSNLKERLSYKYKRRAAAENIKNYKLCDEISEEIGSISKEITQLNHELSELTKKEKKSQGYHKRRLKSSSSSTEGNSFSDEPFFDHSQRCSSSESVTQQPFGKSDSDTIILSDTLDTEIPSSPCPSANNSPPPSPSQPFL